MAVRLESEIMASRGFGSLRELSKATGMNITTARRSLAA
jgi:DNA-binding IclR family transcriptional regulator